MTRPGDWSPLRSRDPVPGDAPAVRALAQRWAGTADAAASAAAGLRAVHASTTVWRSASGRTFQDRTGAAASSVEGVQQRYAVGAQVLHAYARALEQAQDEADVALLRARRAQDDLEAAERSRRSAALTRTLTAAATGGGALPEADERRAADRAAEARSRIARADDALSQAEADWRAAGAAAAAALDEVAQDGLTDRLDGALEVVEETTLWVSRVSAVSGLLSPVAPVLAPLALGTGAVAATGTAVLWLHERATASEVALSALGPVAATASRALRALDEVVPDEALPALRRRQAGGAGAGGSGAAPPASSGPPGRAGPVTGTGGTRTRRAATAADRAGNASDVATLTTTSSPSPGRGPDGAHGR